MKSKKSIDSLAKSLENQKGAILVNKQGKSLQYWCGLSVIGGDHGSLFPPDPNKLKNSDS
ncbi:hypothetical protein [Aquimarina longa]|uniref:hypothetical protein n=1 Tax=Aquimarina longa TaxID=1080221 RepID=UPI000785B6B8|nr:hypothetical protein [Aquimarina longa]